MAKQSGLGDNFYVGGYDLSGDISSVDQLSGGPALLDVTPINAFANVRIGGLRSADWQFTSFFEYASTGQGTEHNALSALPRADVIASYFRGTTLLSPAACLNGKQVSYDPTRDNTGNLTLKVEIQSNGYGMEWGKQLTPGLRTDTTASTGTAQDDNGAGTTFGAQAYLQLVSLTGTSVDVTITHSTASGGTYTTLVDFGSLTAVGSVRAVAAGTVNRFLKVNTAGTFTSAIFAVTFVRNQAATVF
jgi:hypothetical protein